MKLSFKTSQASKAASQTPLALWLLLVAKHDFMCTAAWHKRSFLGSGHLHQLLGDRKRWERRNVIQNKEERANNPTSF